jgi:hypothetical protein
LQPFRNHRETAEDALPKLLVAPVPQAQEANNQAPRLLSRLTPHILAKNQRERKKNLKKKREQKVAKKKLW